MIVVIDGPAGSGKSSTAREIARKLNFDYVDSGAIFRALTFLYNESGKNQDVFLPMLDDHRLDFDFSDARVRVFHKKMDISDKLRSMTINKSVSDVAAMPKVREVVQRLLRDISHEKKVVLEGRDLGTVVFPDADYKFFLTADLEARAVRRYKELAEQGVEGSLEEIKENLKKRDFIDSERDIAPLRKADDAIVVDSTNLNFEEQVARILSYICL